MTLTLRAVGKTDKGLVRPGNEDTLLVDQDHSVFAVCDGMGGAQAGEVASMMAADIVHTSFTEFAGELSEDGALKLDRHLPTSGDVLVKAVRLANRAIYNKANSSSTLHGMGTTVVALALEKNMMSVVHVGDSRAYRIEDRGLVPLTRDHSWVNEIQQSQNLTAEEAASVVGKNVITRALGVRSNVEVDYRLMQINPGDKFLICSDGLCGYADDDEIFMAIRRVRDDLDKVVDNLIQLANDRGGADNVTVVALEVVEVAETDLPEVEPFTLQGESDILLEAEDVWLERINDHLANREAERAEAESSSPNRKNLYLLFGLFIVVAVVIIYFASTR
ncbi:MAG TPA: Stp1/IreP family PP2C-type Ser/Thr phosphatase [candidate division Zixibacteria bacterium]|nr:Stp1/IreP family PP2C-type Ser/Thr phosphatase [candidate division Zixibacteria bacterium]